MAAKEFKLTDGMVVKVYKRRGNRSLRLTLTPSGQIRVSIPAWAPYRVGLEFAKSRHDWILAQRKTPKLLVHGQPIGKAHRLSLLGTPSAARVSTRLSSSTIAVRFPSTLDHLTPEVQKAAQAASIRALRVQAEKLLPQRLANLAQVYGFEYTDVSIKQLSGRWGSCDSNKRIVLNLFLMQLPWELIDYVLFHELTHTKVLKHGSDFWQAMDAVLPNTKHLKKELRNYQPILDGLG